MLDFKVTPNERVGVADIDPADISDVIILGGGPAGLSAGLYAARAGLSTYIIEKETLGGQVATTGHVENCPGCLAAPGIDYAERLKNQAVEFGANIVYAEVLRVELSGNPKAIHTTNGKMLAKSVIIATGASPRKLDVPGEQEYRGRGVSYCATCDGPFFKDKVLAVVGGGDAAVEEANYLTRFASKVVIVHRRDTLRATKIIQDRATSNPRIEFRWNAVVEEILGDQKVTGLRLRDVKTGNRSELPVDGVFVFVGMNPATKIFDSQLRLTSDGYIITDDKMQTNLKGVFAAGDVRHTPLRQVITAAADGAIAATYADRYLHGE